VTLGVYEIVIIHGYKRRDLSGLMEIEEASVAVSPDDLRKLSKFILPCAEKIEAGGEFDHEHYRDFCEGEIGESDFVVLHPKYSTKKGAV